VVQLFYLTPINILTAPVFLKPGSSFLLTQKQTKIMDTSKMITAYCLKTKEKNVPMHDAVVTKTAKGGYMATGNDGKGNKMAAIMGEAKALQAIKDGVAKKGF
jgi:hypothetical protein